MLDPGPTMTFIADSMTFESERSSPELSGNRHTYDRIRQLRAELESLARGYLIWPDASFLIRQRCTYLRVSNAGAVSASLTISVVQEPNQRIQAPQPFPTGNLPNAPASALSAERRRDPQRPLHLDSIVTRGRGNAILRRELPSGP